MISRHTLRLPEEVLTLLLALAASLGTAAMAGTAALDPPESLDRGFRIAARIPTDPHLLDRDKAQYEIVNAYLQLGFVDEAESRTAQMLGWRRGLAYADIAIASLEQGREDQMNVYLEAAAEYRGRVQGWGASWQKARITSRISLCLMKSGDRERARTVLGSVSPKDSVQVRVEDLLTPDKDGHLDLERARDVLAQMGESKHWEVKQAGAEGLIRVVGLLGDGLDEQTCIKIREQVDRAAAELPWLLRHQLKCSLAKALLEAGHPVQGLALLDAATREIRERDQNPRFDPPALVELATVYDESAADSALAVELMTRAEDVYATSAGHLPAMDRVGLLVSLVEGNAKLGRSDQAIEHFNEALGLASDMVNGRPRALAIAELCGAAGRSGLQLPASVLEALDRELVRQVDTW